MNGMWQSQRILSEEWIQKSTKPHIGIERGGDYGFLWFVSNIRHNDKDYRCFYHSGSGGHYLMVLPAYSVVIVINAFRGRDLKQLIGSVIDHVIDKKSN
jgi:CubicO group peptidase (beta-lactamase class C family)